MTRTDYYYETYTSKPFSAPLRAESFVTNHISDFHVQCSYKKKKGKTLVDGYHLNHGAISRDQVDAWVAQMNEADENKREPLLSVRQQAIGAKRAGKLTHSIFH